MQRYRRFSDALTEKFGKRIHKVSLKAGFTCPNRDGILATGGCIYCNDLSLIPSTYDPEDSIREQLRKGMDYIRRKNGAEGFIAYFQSNSNTYLPELWTGHGLDQALKDLEELYRSAIVPGVKGLAIGTRPDCVQEPILDIIKRISEDIPVWVEYGLQSVHDRTLDLINRGHSFKVFVDAVHRTVEKGISVVAHIILGLPGESHDDMRETARVLSRLPVDGIKIHSLHALKGTELEKWYMDGRWKPMSQNDYVSLVVDVLEQLPSQMVVHRLTAESPRIMIEAPQWCGNKHAVLNAIKKELERRDTYQGAKHVG